MRYRTHYAIYVMPITININIKQIATNKYPEYKFLIKVISFIKTTNSNVIKLISCTCYVL